MGEDIADELAEIRPAPPPLPTQSTASTERKSRGGVVEGVLRLFGWSVLVLVVLVAAVWLNNAMKPADTQQTAHVIKGPVLACVDEDDLKRPEHFYEQGDDQAGHKAATRCVMLQDREKVFIEHLISTSGLWHTAVRRPGDTVAYWTITKWVPAD